MRLTENMHGTYRRLVKSCDKRNKPRDLCVVSLVKSGTKSLANRECTSKIWCKRLFYSFLTTYDMHSVRLVAIGEVVRCIEVFCHVFGSLYKRFV